jgi:NTE family protein
LIGAAYIAGRLGELRQWAEAATWREVVGLIDVRLSAGGLIDGKLIVAFLREFGITEAIESYSKPYAAIATDLVSGREIWLQSGPIDEAVRASIALPWIRPGSAINGWSTEGFRIRSLSRFALSQLISMVTCWGGGLKNLARRRQWRPRVFQMNL